jgi:alanyl-tRNA synthetase
MSSKEIRRLFIEYFRERDHEVVPSAPLIPKGDPTLLFTSAGMVPFKPYYVDENPPIRRAVSVQRCLRLSDLDEVGRTPYHATFFEMLGNFSFGDYFKEKAIEWGWEFLTDVIGLPPELLWVTIHEDDDAAHDLWISKVGFPAERIVRLGDKHNFWGPAGDSGPCGPCSEIHYDMGEDVGCGRPDCDPGCDCDRFFEVGNLVFPQYLQHSDGTREPLKRPGIDTGIGFERLVSLVQGVGSIHETDVFAPIVDATRDLVEEATGFRPSEDGVSADLAVISDHARAVAFTIAENILPSNEGQGYVVRRLVRRAVRRGLALGLEDAFLYRLTGVVADEMGDAHPHLKQKREHVALVVKSEEERFSETLVQGSAVFEEMVSVLASRGESVLSGADAFRLYDTYGFPLDLTQEMASERDLTVDLEGFREEMEAQKARGRQASTFAAAATGGDWEGRRAATEFTGYAVAQVDAAAAELAAEGACLSEPLTTVVAEVRRRDRGDTVEFTLESTPFYAEAGGQVSDAGAVAVGDTTLRVVSVYYGDERLIHVAEGEGSDAIAPGVSVSVSIDMARRRMIEKNHTATHLLQAALRGLLGDHVHQSGSWVGPDRLRFDFTHHSELSGAELEDVVERVNAWIRADLPVSPETMKLDEATARGAMALFGEKYENDVRVVCVGDQGDVSAELCGGTHVRRTGEIGSFAVVSESSVAAGVRRIEALTGRGAAELAGGNAAAVRRLAEELRTVPERSRGSSCCRPAWTLPTSSRSGCWPTG